MINKMETVIYGAKFSTSSFISFALIFRLLKVIVSINSLAVFKTVLGVERRRLEVKRRINREVPNLE